MRLELKRKRRRAVQGSVKGKIINTIWELKKKGYKKSTLQTYLGRLLR